ncbi:MAG: hypothetical protein ABIE14_02900 [Patescibacteria group bacterium]
MILILVGAVLMYFLADFGYSLFLEYENVSATSLSDWCKKILLMVSFICLATLTLAKKNSWEKMIRIIVLVFTVAFIYFNTSIQLLIFFKVANQITNPEVYNAWISDQIDFWTMYEIWKIIFMDFFAVFLFLAVNKTLDKIKD